MTLYPVYSGITCPVCGSADHNRDLGPYEVAFPSMTEDHGSPEVHYIACRNCGKGFDAGPPRASFKWQALFDRSLA